MALRNFVKILSILSLFSFISISAYAAPPWPIPEGLKTVEVNGYEMAYLEAGSGVPILLIHGSLTDYRTWENQIPYFQNHIGLSPSASVTTTRKNGTDRVTASPFINMPLISRTL
jgi:hypothetical protein